LEARNLQNNHLLLRFLIKTGADMNPIFKLIADGHYEMAWTSFEALEQPSPMDDRWAGYALAILGRGLEARDVLLRARRRGCQEAGIELSFTLQSIGEFAQAKEALSRLDLGTFSALDRAFSERQAGMLALADGDYRMAIQSFELAWVSAHDDEDGAIALPGIAQALAFSFAHLGNDVRANHYYGFALEHGSSAMRGSLLLARAASRINLDRIAEAESDLNAARELLVEDPFSQASLELHTAEISTIRGLWQQAADQFLNALKLADAVGNNVIACSAELGAASAFIPMRDFRRARTHLDRAAKRCETPSSWADLALLEGEWFLRNGQLDLAIGQLERAVEQFTVLHTGRSVGMASVFLAEAHLMNDHPLLADVALERVADIWQALLPDSSADLEAGSRSLNSILNELRSLPRLLEYLESQPKHLARPIFDACVSPSVSETSISNRLHLTSLGSSKLDLNGRSVRLDLRRCLEVLAYLIRFSQTQPQGPSLKEVLCDLFPDTPPGQARLYFHQVRYELEKKIPGFAVSFMAASRTYAIQTEIALTWDVLEFEAGLNEANAAGALRAFEVYAGPFMPQAEGDWLEAERARLNAQALRSGLEWCRTWYERGHFGRCIQLTSRLLELDGLDENLSELLVRATESLEGRVAARQTVKRLRKRFELELGVPVALEAGQFVSENQFGLEKQ
jgi:two-component SAPR family response regulator